MNANVSMFRRYVSALTIHSMMSSFDLNPTPITADTVSDGGYSAVVQVAERLPSRGDTRPSAYCHQARFLILQKKDFLQGVTWVFQHVVAKQNSFPLVLLGQTLCMSRWLAMEVHQPLIVVNSPRRCWDMKSLGDLSEKCLTREVVILNRSNIDEFLERKPHSSGKVSWLRVLYLAC
jgi:hypothetical protein